MTLELGDVGRVAAELMDELAADLEHEHGARVDAVLIVVAVSTGKRAEIRYRSNDLRPWVHRALLAEAVDLAATADEPDDEL